jgi:activator of mitotic machinery (Cdc14 phosphatase activation)
MSSASPTHYEHDPRDTNGNGLNVGPDMGRRGSDTATQSFPLNDIDYESDPMAVAQELSNLQAIRRMSMDVNGMDPDLPAFNLSLGVPTVAPSHRSDEEDPSRLFWVPASVHPELAPNQFKTFIQERVRTLKRSSLSEQPLAPENTSAGASGLRRKKSMLSRQIDNGNGYEDGATRLERRKSKSGQPPLPVNLHELEELISDPNLVRRSIDSGEVPISEDMPILPAKPAGQTLKRSTRTQYRRGSLRKGSVIARRQTLKNAEEEQNEKLDPTGSKPPQLPDVPALPDLSELANSTFGLTRTQTEPVVQSPSKAIENFSRPGRRLQTPPTQQSPSTSWNQGGFDEAPTVENPEISPVKPESDEHRQAAYHSRYANGRPTQFTQPIPQIIESQPDEPPPPQHLVRSNSLPVQAPERKSSMEPSAPPTGPLPRPGAAQRQQASRPQSLPQRPPGQNNHRPANITLDDIAGSPSMLPGNSNRSDSLSVIPTYHEEGKKLEKKNKREDGSRKPSWGWFSSSNSEEKEREKREKEEREAAKKNKSKLQKPGDARHDARLDVLQTSIDGTPRRESNVFDRQSLSIPDDNDNSRKPTRKTSGDVKKEKDSGIFSSLFGSSKRKSEKETGGSGGKKGSSLRGLSPDPPPRILRADIDYNWSRFSILEERAIYRMAHIKLANPRRELYSQVLLSNFMYSYLAKVQQMHPQIQIPQSAAQKQQQRQEKQQQAKALEDERRMRQQQAERQASMQQQQQQPQSQGQGQVTVEEFAQYQRYQEVRISAFPNRVMSHTNMSRQQQARLEEQQRYGEHDDIHHQQQQYNARSMHQQQQQGYGPPQHHQQQQHSRHQPQQQAQQQQQQHADYQYQQQYGMNGQQSMYNGGHHPDYVGHGRGFNVQGGGMIHNQGQQQYFPVSEQAGGGAREEGFW